MQTQRKIMTYYAINRTEMPTKWLSKANKIISKMQNKIQIKSLQTNKPSK